MKSRPTIAIVRPPTRNGFKRSTVEPPFSRARSSKKEELWDRIVCTSGHCASYELKVVTFRQIHLLKHSGSRLRPQGRNTLRTAMGNLLGCRLSDILGIPGEQPTSDLREYRGDVQPGSPS
jgi:hypothetical protein